MNRGRSSGSRVLSNPRNNPATSAMPRPVGYEWPRPGVVRRFTPEESSVISVNIHPRRTLVSVEEARRCLQEKYNKEAEEAAEKQRQKEQKKREAWLARQEKLVRPGQVLGHDRQVSQMLQRDVDGGSEDEFVSTQRQRMQDQYRELAEQHSRRLREADEMRIVRERYNAGQPERASVQLPAVTSRPPPVRGGTNQTAEHFLGTGYNGAASSSVPGAAVGARPAAGTRPAPSARPAPRASTPTGHVLGSSAATTPASDVDPREQMLAARARLQAQYDQQVQQLATADESEGQDTAN